MIGFDILSAHRQCIQKMYRLSKQEFDIRKRLKRELSDKSFFSYINFDFMNYYMVYLSAATQIYSDLDISQILTVSRKNNAEKNITGILLYHDGNILQVLEGDKQAVTELYQKIKADERHKGVIQIVQGTSEERNFAEWSMGFKAVNNSDWNEYEGYIKLDKAGLLWLIKKKNLKIDTTIKSFAKSFNVTALHIPKII